MRVSTCSNHSQELEAGIPNISKKLPTAPWPLSNRKNGVEMGIPFPRMLSSISGSGESNKFTRMGLSFEDEVLSSYHMQDKPFVFIYGRTLTYTRTQTLEKKFHRTEKPHQILRLLLTQEQSKANQAMQTEVLYQPTAFLSLAYRPNPFSSLKLQPS